MDERIKSKSIRLIGLCLCLCLCLGFISILILYSWMTHPGYFFFINQFITLKTISYTALSISVFFIIFYFFYVWQKKHINLLSHHIILPLGIGLLGGIFFILIWKNLIDNEQKKIFQLALQQAELTEKSIYSTLHFYKNTLSQMQERITNQSYTSSGSWEKDAQAYIKNMPAIQAIAILNPAQVDKENHPELMVHTNQVQRNWLRECLQNKLIPLKYVLSTTLIVNVRHQFICILLPIIYQKKPQLLLGFINLDALFNDAITTIPDIKQYRLEILQYNTVIYRHNAHFSPIHDNWTVSLPIQLEQEAFTLKVWPQMELFEYSWLPIISLIVGLLITLVLASVTYLLQSLAAKAKELKQSELKFKEVLANISDAIIIFDKKGLAHWVNRAAVELFGYTEEELLGMEVETLIPSRFHAHHRELRAQYMKAPYRRKMGTIDNIVLQTQKAEEIPADIDLSPIQLNKKSYILCSIHNIQGIKNNEEKLIHQTRLMQLTLDTTNSIAQEENFERAIAHCLYIICSQLHWPIGHVYLVDETNKDLLQPSDLWFFKDKKAYQLFYQKTMQTTICYGECVPGRVLASGTPIWFEDVAKEYNSPREAICSELNLHTAMAFPIKKNGKIFAVFEFFTEQLKKQDYTMLVAINVLSNQISRFIEYQDILLKHKELAERFQFAVSAGKIGVWELNLKTDTLIWDDQMFKIYGVDPNQFQGHYDDWENQLHPEDVPEVVAQFKDTIQSKKDFEAEFRIIRPDGEIRYIQANATISYSDNHEPESFLGVNLDMTNERLLTKELQELNEKLEHYANYDSLTQLMNRRMFERSTKELFHHAKKNKKTLAILFMDLDLFKQVNDRYGHTAGDEVLKEAARRFNTLLRKQDKLCRFGGDEFAILLQDIENAADALQFAERMIDHFNDPFHPMGVKIQIGLSIGIALYPNCGDTLNELIKKADFALLKAKKQPDLYRIVLYSETT